MDVVYSFVFRPEIDQIARLLHERGLPAEDISEHLPNFLCAKHDDNIVGVAGVEVLGQNGLFRSLAIVPEWEGRGIGHELYWRVVAHCRRIGISQLYLLTATADGFFKRLGFSLVDRVSVPPEVQATRQFRELCPSSATCLQKDIKAEAHYYPRETLKLQPDSSGALMDGVHLTNTLFTYFEIEPNTRFDSHSHESEQITMVLQGELFFDTAEATFCVREGDVIAIPSNIPHAVFTKERGARAVDAWSPVMPQYSDHKG